MENFFKVKNKIELNNCYIKNIDTKILNYILYDINYIYLNSHEYFSKDLIKYNLYELHTTVIDNFEFLDNTYILLLFQESAVSSHFYEQFVRMFDSSLINNNNNIIIYNTEDIYYNSSINFIIKYIFNSNNKIIRIKNNVLYKIKNLIIYPIDYKSDNGILHYGKFLDSFIDNREKKNYYNIKFNTDKNLWTSLRSFNYSNNIINILEKNKYIQLDISNEYNKQLQLQNSEKVILTWGGNHTINMIMSLYMKSKELLILCSIDYNNEYTDFELYKYKDINNYYIGLYHNNYVMFVFDIKKDIENLESILYIFENIKNKLILEKK
jgi:hypothetical protein